MDPPTPPGGAPPPAPAGDDIDAKINAAVTARLSRFESSLGKSLDERFAKLALPAPAPGESPPAPGAPVDRTAELEKQVKSLEAARKRDREELQKERQSQLERSALGELRAELSGKVRPDLSEDLADLLFRARGVVKVASDGSATITVAGEDLPLRDGVAAILKDPRFAAYLPAPTARAPQGGRPGARPAARGAPPAARGAAPPPENESPAQKTARQFAELGLSL